MSNPARSSYAQLLRAPGAAAAFAAATLARLSYATISLALLLVVQESTGSFAAAGAALGAFGLPVVASPFIARLIDRYGRARILIPSGAGYGMTLLTVAVCGMTGVTTISVYVALSATAGLLAPPVGPVMRQIWAGIAGTSQDRQRAYSLDTVSEEVLFAIGPLTVAGVVAISGPATAMVGTACVGLLGSVALATRPVSACGSPPDVSNLGRWWGPLSSPGFRWLAAVMLIVGLGMTPLEVAVVARSTEVGTPAAAGLVLTAMSVASAAGGLLWGHLRHRRSPAIQLAGLLVVLAAGSLAAGLLPSLPTVAVILTLAGLATSPIFVVAYLLADELVPSAAQIEASTWLSTTHNLGGAAGAAAAGLLIDHSTAQSAFVAGGLILAVTAAVLVAARRRLEVISR